MEQLGTWSRALAAELGLDPATNVPVEAILDVARDAAHGVLRPAAPVSAYLLALAVANGTDPVVGAETVARLASGWPQGT